MCDRRRTSSLFNVSPLRYFCHIVTDPTIPFGWPFFGRSCLAAAAATAFLGIPGASAARALGITGDRRSIIGRWMMAPALGLILFCPVAFTGLCVIHFTLLRVILLWGVFIAVAELIARRRIVTHLIWTAIDNRKAALLIGMAAVWAVLPAENIYPFTYREGLYTNNMLADHVKIAFIDAIAREGMPMKNPFYAPQGQRILLSYSYGWYLPGAIVKRLTGCTGWQAEVGMSWFTSFAIMLFLAVLAAAFSGGAAGGFWFMVVAIVGPLSFGLFPMVFGTRMLPVIGLPKSHGLEVPWLQLAWAPQHMCGAIAVFVALWFSSAALAESVVRKRLIVGIGLAVAMGFESSSWVGGVALLAASPVLIIAAACLRLERRHYLAFIRTIGLAIALAAICVLPLITVLMRGTAQAEHEHSIGLGIFPSTDLENHLGLHGNAKLVARIILFWIHLLPLSYGVIYLLGLPAMIAIQSKSTEERTFRAVSIGGTVGFLLVSQFLQSTIRANDLGWRAVNVAVMFMCIYAAAAIVDLLKQPNPAAERWRRPAWLPGRWMPGTPVISAITFGVMALGLLGTAQVMGLPMPLTRPDPDVANLHQAYAWQFEAWEAVRRLTRPTDLVQSNPDAFEQLPPWPICLPYHLFADRPSAYSCDATARTYAFRYSWDENRAQGELVTSLFAFDPDLSTIAAVRALDVKAILVTPDDPVWYSSAIDDSGIYRLAVHKHQYKVYIAIKR